MVILLLLISGFIRMPWEKQLSAHLISAELLLPPPGDTLREQMGQSATLATLGGLRSLVSIYMTLHAHDAWQMTDWETVEQDYRMITTMEPRDIDNWIRGAWHMWANASANMEMNESIPKELRSKLQHEYIDKGIQILRQGAINNPDSYKPWVELGYVLRLKKADYCGAAEAYKEALARNGTPGMITRFYGYMLAQCSGHEQEAYDYLRKLYDEGDKHRQDSVIVSLKNLELKLGIPLIQRIPDPHPETRRRERAEKLKSRIGIK